MFANVYTFTLRERALGFVLGAVGFFLLCALGMVAYADLGESIAELSRSMPPALLGMMGITPDADASSFVLSEMANFIAPLVLSGLAISVGTSGIAGEEQANTMAVLLGNPHSRSAVLAAKVSSLATLVILGGGLFYLAFRGAVALGGGTLEVELGAMVLHLMGLALFFGAFAVCVGAWSGRPAVATGAAVALLVVSWLSAGILPMIDSLADVAKVSPWYYFSASSPLHEGADVGHLAVLIGLSAALFTLSFVGLRRRDLRFGDGAGLLASIKRHPLGKVVLDKLAGGGAVQNITLRTISESQTVTGVVTFYLALLAVAVGPMFNAISGALKSMMEKLPKAILAMIGSADMSTANGWYWGEVYSLVAPGAMILVVATIGIRAIAGETAAHTLDILLANPVPRWRILLEKALALEVMAALLATGLFFGVLLGCALGDLDIAWTRVAAASVHLFALGVLFGMIALAAGALTGSKKAATYSVAGVALFGWALNAFLPMRADLAPYAKLSPFYYFADAAPLSNGVEWSHIVVLMAAASACFGGALIAFSRRDIRG